MKKYTPKYLQNMIDTGLLKSGRVLDVGCGVGTVAKFLTKKGFMVDALDIKERDVPNFTKADIRDFTIPKKTYDLIHCRYVLHFLKKKEMKLVLMNMWNGLKKGGVLYFTLKGTEDDYKNDLAVTLFTDNEAVKLVSDIVPIYSRNTFAGLDTTTGGKTKFCHSFFFTCIKQ